MQLSVLANPVAIYCILGAGLVCAFVVCFVLFSNFRALERHLLAGQKAAESQVESLRLAVVELSKDLDLFEESAKAVQAQPLRSGLNLTKRSQALRMHRRGDAVEKIALTLDLPRQEVDLLLKVHHIVVSNL